MRETRITCGRTWKFRILGSGVLVLALAASVVLSAEPAVPRASAGAAAPGGVAVLSNTTLWRQFQIARHAFVRHEDGSAVPYNIDFTRSARPLDGGLGERPVCSPLPPENWTDTAFDDGDWPRVRLPQPVLTLTGGGQMQGSGGRIFFRPYDISVVLARGAFEVKNPAQVRECRLSLEYWGGVVVYVNGREFVRGHMPAGEHDLMALAEDYPVDALTTPEGKPLFSDDQKNRARLAMRDRALRDVNIPSSLLRPGANVIGIAVHAAVSPRQGVPNYGQTGWAPVGLVAARLNVSPAGTAGVRARPPGAIEVWNTAGYDTVTAFDYGAAAEPLRPIMVRAPRNGVFSGRLMVGSDRPIKGLKIAVTALKPRSGNVEIPASAIRIRYAEPAVPAKSWSHPSRFDGLLDAIPAEIPVVALPAGANRMGFASKEGNGMKFGPWFHHRTIETELTPRAVAPLWFTVRVPANTTPGTYEGTVTVSAEGMNPVSVPLRVNVCAWTMPAPKDFRATNFIQHSEEALALHYGVPRWSDKHFELIGKSLALLAEVNSRRVNVNLAVDFHGDGANAESLVRWIRQPDGSFSHDYAVLDKYLDTVAKAVGKPLPLRLNCWGAVWGNQFPGAIEVSVLDPATGEVRRMPQPALGSEESFAFWKPVFDEILKRIRARGWLDVTALGYNSWRDQPEPRTIVDVARKLWPEGVWCSAGHTPTFGMKFDSADKGFAMPVRFANTVWFAGEAQPRGARALLAPRNQFWCFNYRERFNDSSPLTDLRRIPEDMIMSGHDGVSDFGADLFPLKSKAGANYVLPAGRGMNWANSRVLTQALLAPGPDGPIATERFEMFREGVQMAEAVLFIERALQEKKLGDDLAKRANAYLDGRSQAFIRGWYGLRYMQSEDDAKLLDLAGEVAGEVQK